LDDDDFATRERASKELKKAGHHAEVALRAALADGPGAEGRRRMGRLWSNSISSVRGRKSVGRSARSPTMVRTTVRL
jgi:hypothetical protein